MMHVIRFSGNERLSERLSWRLFGHLRRKRIGASKVVREVHKRDFVTVLATFTVLLYPQFYTILKIPWKEYAIT